MALLQTVFDFAQFCLPRDFDASLLGMLLHKVEMLSELPKSHTDPTDWNGSGRRDKIALITHLLEKKRKKKKKVISDIGWEVCV